MTNNDQEIRQLRLEKAKVDYEQHQFTMQTLLWTLVPLVITLIVSFKEDIREYLTNSAEKMVSWFLVMPDTSEFKPLVLGAIILLLLCTPLVVQIFGLLFINRMQKNHDSAINKYKNKIDELIIDAHSKKK